jgi:hypothetical protein
LASLRGLDQPEPVGEHVAELGSATVVGRECPLPVFGQAKRVFGVGVLSPRGLDSRGARDQAAKISSVFAMLIFGLVEREFRSGGAARSAVDVGGHPVRQVEGSSGSAK